MFIGARHAAVYALQLYYPTISLMKRDPPLFSLVFVKQLADVDSPGVEASEIRVKKKKGKERKRGKRGREQHFLQHQVLSSDASSHLMLRAAHFHLSAKTTQKGGKEGKSQRRGEREGREEREALTGSPSGH